MRGHSEHEQNDRRNQGERGHATGDEAKRAIQRVPAHAMSHNGGRDQNDDHNRKQPSRADHQGTRQGQINSADRQQRQHCLPPRLRFVDFVVGIAHWALL